MKQVCFLVILGLILSLAVVAEDSLLIPPGTEPTIDGDFTLIEWDGAQVVEITSADEEVLIRVHLVHDGEQLFAAFEYPRYPDGELLIPEILIDPLNAKAPEWTSNDWWFHVSAQDCEAQGEYDNYNRCNPVRSTWTGLPNFRPSPHSAPLDAIEVSIPLSLIDVPVGEPFGLMLRVLSESYPILNWPLDGSIESPATWSEALLATE